MQSFTLLLQNYGNPTYREAVAKKWNVRASRNGQ